MKKYFLDVNVIADLLMKRSGYNSEVASMLAEVPPKNIFISALTIHILFYTFKIKYGTDVYEDLTAFLKSINILPITSENVRKALDTDYKDFEDLLQYYSAETTCDTIITRDKKDFENIKRITKGKINIISRYTDK